MQMPTDDNPVVVWEGDCLDLLRRLPSASIDAVVTDPPYSSGGAFRGDRMNDTRTKYQSSGVVKEFEVFGGDNRDQRAYGYWCCLWLSELLRVTKPGSMLCMFTDWRQLPSTTDAVQAGGWVWRGIVPWDKIMARPMPGRFRAQAEYVVWATNGPRDFSMGDDAVYGDGIIRVKTPHDRVHSTQKPTELIQELLRTASKPGDIVFDGFAGSGTTGVASAMEGRKCILVEREFHYAEESRRRVAEVLGRNGLFRDMKPNPPADLFAVA